MVLRTTVRAAGKRGGARCASVLAQLGAAALGFTLWWAWAQSRPEAPLASFTLAPGTLSVASLHGEMRPHPNAIEVAGLGRLVARTPIARDDVLELDAVLPAGASLLLRQGEGAPLAPQRSAGEPPRPPGPGILFDRGPAGGIRGLEGVQCAPRATLPEEAVSLALTFGPDGVRVSGGSEPVLCTGKRIEGTWSLRSGAQMVRLTRVMLTGGTGTKLAFDGRGWAFTPFAAMAVAGLCGLLGAMASRRWPLLGRALAPALVGPLLTMVDLRPWLEAMRVLDFPEAGVPAVAALLGVSALAIPRLVTGRSLPVALAVSCLPAVACVPLLLGGWEEGALATFALAAVPYGAIVWANQRQVRFVGPWSWAGCLAMLLIVELAIRGSSLNRTWVRTAGYERAATEFRELLELKKWRRYPREGFPAQPPPPDGARRRVVAFGGSSTGGAYQMDDLDLFWPRELEAQLGSGWQVVNQGVGGWNTLHIRLYAESQMAALDPDVVVLYAGHNDILSRAAAPHATLLQRYREPEGAWATSLSRTLHAWRVFVGFKFFVASWRADAAVAVPVAHAEDNVRVLVQAAQASGAHVLLVTEGLSPDPSPMAEYTAMLQRVAAEEGERSFDAASAFMAPSDPDDFIDDCHLTTRGHARLAAWVKAELAAAGWI